MKQSVSDAETAPNAGAAQISPPIPPVTSVPYPIGRAVRTAFRKIRNPDVSIPSLNKLMRAATDPELIAQLRNIREAMITSRVTDLAAKHASGIALTAGEQRFFSANRYRPLMNQVTAKEVADAVADYNKARAAYLSEVSVLTAEGLNKATDEMLSRITSATAGILDWDRRLLAVEDALRRIMTTQSLRGLVAKKIAWNLFNIPTIGLPAITRGYVAKNSINPVVRGAAMALAAAVGVTLVLMLASLIGDKKKPVDVIQVAPDWNAKPSKPAKRKLTPEERRKRLEEIRRRVNPLY